MKNYTEELTPIEYGPEAVKLLNVVAEAGVPSFFLHWHNRMELILLKKGELTIGYGEKTAVLYPDEIYIIPPKMPHYAIAKKTKCEWDVLMFDIRSYYNSTELCQNYLRPLFEGRVEFDLTTNNCETVKCFKDIVSLYQKNNFKSVALIYEIIALLFKHSLVAINSDVKGRAIITDAIEYIKSNLAEEISTKLLAEKFSYTEEHFCRLFKNTTHFTPMNYLKICRLEKAARLITSEKYTITEVANKCGFSDSNYFTRCFKSHFKTVPSKFKTENFKF